MQLAMGLSSGRGTVAALLQHTVCSLTVLYMIFVLVGQWVYLRCCNTAATHCVQPDKHKCPTALHMIQCSR